jgi:L-ribulokinase
MRQIAMGIDFGTDSVRALLVDCQSGAELAASVAVYRRWARSDFCDPTRSRFRQHPLDSIESLEECVPALLRQSGVTPDQIIGIGVDTTGSTPVAVDTQGCPLALLEEFATDADAMFVLWKDHTAVAEAEEINVLAHSGRFVDYTKYSGGIYSPEWFWAKAAHILRANPRIAEATAGWVEHCDWLPGLLTGTTAPQMLARSRCAAGHKAMWHEAWKGLPAHDFLQALEPRLLRVARSCAAQTFTSAHRAGTLCASWAQRLGLRCGIPVAVGALDAHMGAVGAGIEPFVLAKVMGTSTCDMMVVPAEALAHPVTGICGQVDGSIVPGLIGLEAGQSAFGDVYAWYRDLLTWPLTVLGYAEQAGHARAQVLDALEKAALERAPAGQVTAVDWFNGRRTPDADPHLRGAIAGLHVSSDAPTIYRALVEATAYGSRAIVERFVEQGVAVERIIALGGIARRSRLVMQVCCDVLNRPISVVGSDQCCALGSAIAAAVAAGVFPDMPAAQKRMSSRSERTYRPQQAHARAYDRGYQAYQNLGKLRLEQAGR